MKAISYLQLFALGLAASSSLWTAESQAQTVCFDTSEGRTCRIQQPIINGALVDPAVQQDLGLITVSTAGFQCSGTLLNRFWVLTADHCVTTNLTVGGPTSALSNLSITAAWSRRIVTPTRVVRNWNASGLDIALIFLGAGDFGKANIQLIADSVDTSMTLTKFGRGIFAYARVGPPPVPTQQDGNYRSAVFTPSAASATSYTLLANPANQVGAGGDSGGPDRVTAPDGVILGIAGVLSTCNVQSRVPGMPTTPVWRWVTAINSCTSAAISAARFDIVQIIQEGRIPCPDTSVACAVAETTSLTLMLR